MAFAFPFDHHHQYYEDEDSSDGERFQAVYRCYSAVFLNDRERTSIENGGKILLPESALEQLIHQEGIMLFQLKNAKHNRQTHCGVLEFLPNKEPICYLPQWMMNYLLLEDGDEIQVQSIEQLPRATFVRFQPQSKTFLDITNPKAVLEKHLRHFSCLTKGDMISINYLNHNYDFFVEDLKPANAVLIIDCDMEVDFAPPVDYVEPKFQSTKPKEQQSHRNSPITTTTTTTTAQFLPFNGHGNRLNGKLRSNGNKERNQLETVPTRGVPNYDYKYGLLQFPRQPLRAVNDERNENVEKTSSAIFQPFTGEGKSLRQPRNQQPK